MTDDAVDEGGPAGAYTLALRPGAQLGGRYVVLRVLSGASDYALTYLAHDGAAVGDRGGAVVVKEFVPRGLVGRGVDGVAIRAHSPDDEREFARALRRFVREAETLVELRHESLPTMLDLVEANGTAYAIMRREEAYRLTEFLPTVGGRLSATAAVELVMPILGGLEMLHAEGILHRDLSPQTVHVRPDGSALLLGPGAWRHVSGRTREAAPGFAPIEQYGGRDVGPWSDVYGAAAILYYLVSGVAPTSAIERAAGAPLRSPGVWGRDVSPPIANAIVRGLSLSPEGRPHSAAELRRHFEEALVLGGESALPRSLMDLPPELSAASTTPRESVWRDDAPAAPFTLNSFGVVVPREQGGMERAMRRVTDMAARLTRRYGGERGAPGDASDADAGDESPRPLATGRRPDPVYDAQPAGAAVTDADERAVQLDEAFARPATADESTGLVPVTAPATEVAALTPAGELSVVEARDQGAVARVTVLLPQPRRTIRTVLAAATMLLVASAAAVAALRPGFLGLRSNPNAPRQDTHRVAARSAGSIAVAPSAAIVRAAAAPSSAAVVPQGSPSGPSGAASLRGIPARPANQSVQLEVPRLPASLASVVGSPSVAAAQPRLESDVVMDVRSRLSVALEQADGGNYEAARQTLAGALARVDSVAARSGDATTLRGVRRDLEAAARRTADACGAESAMRRRRGQPALTCS